MKVRLNSKFFTPDNRLLKPGIHTVPDDWMLPKSTEKLGDEEEEELDSEPKVKAPAKKPVAK